MAVFLPPPPNPSTSTDDYVWRDWFRKLQSFLMGVSGIAWNALDFSGSNLTDIETRNHNDLQNIQGGSSTERYHLSATQYNNLGEISGPLKRIIRNTYRGL